MRPTGRATRQLASIYSAGTGITRTVASGADQAVPIVSGALVAYASGTGDDREIYVWDSTNGIDEPGHNQRPPGHGAGPLRRICWPGSGGTARIGRSADGPLLRWRADALPNNFVDDQSPVVEGILDSVRAGGPGGDTSEVFVRLYNVSTGVNTLVTSQSDPAQDLRMDDDLLAFVSTPDYPAHTCKQIMLYNPATRVLRALTTDLDHHVEMESVGGLDRLRAR